MSRPLLLAAAKYKPEKPRFAYAALYDYTSPRLARWRRGARHAGFGLLVLSGSGHDSSASYRCRYVFTTLLLYVAIAPN